MNSCVSEMNLNPGDEILNLHMFKSFLKSIWEESLLSVLYVIVWCMVKCR